MDKTLEGFLDKHLPVNGTIGIVGVGKLGGQVREYAAKRGLDVLLCDPPRSYEEAAELGETFFDLWGNGMGGCQLTNVGMETYLPLDSLARADAICVQVPLVADGKYPTAGMIDAAFLAKCSPSMRIICLSDKAVISCDAIQDGRVVCYEF